MQDDPDRHRYVSIVILCIMQLFACQWPADRLMEEVSIFIIDIIFFIKLIIICRFDDKVL